MIENIWELGTIGITEDTKEPIIGYRIEMLWHEGELECRKSFEGDNPNIVQIDAMQFILNHYKKNNL